MADGGPDMEPGMPELEEPELGPELSDVTTESSLASSLSDFNTRSPWAEAQRFREASSDGAWSAGVGPLRLALRDAVRPEGGETRCSARDDIDDVDADFVFGMTNVETSSTTALSSAMRWLPS